MRTILRIVSYVVLFGSLIGALAALSFVLLLSLRPLSLDRFLGADKRLAIDEKTVVQLRNTELYFSLGFHLRAGEVNLLLNQQPLLDKPAAVDVRLRTSSLLTGKIRPSTVSAHGLVLDVKRTSAGIIAAGQPVSFAPDKSRAPFELVRFLDMLQVDPERAGYLAALRKIEIKDSKIGFQDEPRNSKWEARELLFSFNKRRLRRNITVSMSALVSRDSQIVPLNLELVHNQGAAFADFSGEARLPGLKIFCGYLPDLLSYAVNAPVVAGVSGRVGAGTAIEEPKFELHAGPGEIDLRSVFAERLPFSSIAGAGRFENNTLFIDRFRFTDPQNFTIDAKVILSDLGAAPSIFFAASLSDTDVDYAARYLPANANPPLSRWLGENLRFASMRNGVVKFAGPLSRFPFHRDYPGTRFNASFDFENLDVQFWDKMPVGKGLSGRFEMNRDLLVITGKDGTLAGQQVPQVVVTLNDVMKPEMQTSVNVQGEAAGEAKDVLQNVINKIVGGGVSNLDVQGKQKARVKIDVPIGRRKERGPAYSIVSRVERARTTIPGTPLVFESPFLDVSVNEREIQIGGKGSLDKQPAEIVLTGETLRFAETAKAEARLQPAGEFFQRYVPPEYLELQGAADGLFKLELHNEKLYSYSLVLDLKNTAAAIPYAGWKKEPGAAGRLEASGTLSVPEKMLAVTAISAESPNFSFKGHGRFFLTEPARSVFSLEPLVLAGSNLALFRYDAGKIKVEGSRLDLAGFTRRPKKEEEKKEPAPDFSAGFDLGELVLHTGVLREVRGSLERTGGRYAVLNVAVKPSKQGSAEFKTEEQSGKKILKISSNDAGALFQVLGVAGDFRGGNLRGSLAAGQGKDLQFDDARLQMNVKDMRVLNSPFFWKILSFFSLQKWINPGEGVIFSKISISCTLDGSRIKVEQAEFQGPLITIFLKGTVERPDWKLDLAGTAVPLRGIGNLAEKVPLLGRTVSNVQKAVLSAGFTARGTASDPQVDFNINPF